MCQISMIPAPVKKEKDLVKFKPGCLSVESKLSRKTYQSIRLII